MPTIPPRQQPHQHREVAESFGADAERYDRARPSYPREMVDRIVAASPGPDVVDVGCGTGIAARQFAAAGCRVLGVEVDERMADLARRDGFDVDASAFETWDPAGRTFDAVIAAQAWHWVDPVAGAEQAARALRPGGRLAVFWNVFRAPDDIAAAFAAVYRQVVPELPFEPWTGPAIDMYRTMFVRTTDGMRAANAFGEPEEWWFDWSRTYTRDEWLEQVPTHGGHSTFPKSTQDELLAGIGAAIDAAGGSFTMGYDTVVITSART